MGNPQRDFRIQLAEIERRLPRVLRAVLPSTSHIPRAVFGADFDWDEHRYLSELKEARPVNVLASRRYEQDDNAITVANVLWELVVDCFQLSADSAVGPVLGYENAVLTGAIQAYLPDDDERLAQVVSAQLRAATLPSPTRAIGG